MAKSHTHITETGMIVRCYHESKTLLKTPSFWIGMTLGYPLEHLIWEKIWPFSWLIKFIGL
jgi:hypothetical protein